MNWKINNGVKISILLLSLVISLALFSGCDSQNGEANNADSTQSALSSQPTFQEQAQFSSVEVTPLGAKFTPTTQPIEADFQGTVLILFDNYDGPWNFGKLYANMTANLVNSYKFDYNFMDVADYQAGDMATFNAVIYLGTIYANVAPAAFLTDVANKVRPVFWINYNLWSIAWDAQYVVDWGFQYNFVNAQSDYLDINYKGKVFPRHELCEEYNMVTVTDATKAEVKAWLSSVSNPADQVPYIVAGDGLWFCADNPLSWLNDGGRYLVFADLLGEFLGVAPSTNKVAMVRLEDVSPGIADTATLKKIGRKLKRLKVPFTIGVIPVFKDPTGAYFGEPVEIPLTDDPELISVLNTLEGWGGTVLIHGYTHQYDAASGDDWEFWEEIGNTPIPGDSVSWCQNRIDSGLAVMNAAGFFPTIWETPHYSASNLDYTVFADNFNIFYERTRMYNNFDANMHKVIVHNKMGQKKGMISTSIYPEIIGAEELSLEQIRGRSFLSAGAQATNGSKAAGDEDVYILQYATLPVQETIYGNYWIPENLGYLEPGVTEATKILEGSEKLGVLNNAVASFFYHHDYPTSMLTDTVKGMQKQGYTFVSPDTLMANY